MRIVRVCVAATLLAACRGADAAPGAAEPARDPADVHTANATMVRDVDGDTILVRVAGREEHVRLIGIDTPETVKRDTPVQCWGHEASADTAALLPPGTALHLERDAEARDGYGRLLAYVYRAADGLFVNLELARRGDARLLTFTTNTAHAAELATASRTAQHARLGLWGACPASTVSTLAPSGGR